MADFRAHQTSSRKPCLKFGPEAPTLTTADQPRQMVSVAVVCGGRLPNGGINVGPCHNGLDRDDRQAVVGRIVKQDARV